MSIYSDLPIPRQEFIPSRGGPVVCDALDDVGDIGLWVDAVELAYLDHGVDRGGALAAELGTCEKPVLAADRHAAQRAFGNQVVDLNRPLPKKRVSEVQRLVP